MNRNKILFASPPKKYPDLFLRLFKSESLARKFSNNFIIPRRRMTMPQIMNLEKPCLTCAWTDQGCPDRKEDVVICSGDYIDNRPVGIIQSIEIGKLTHSIKEVERSMDQLTKVGKAGQISLEVMKSNFINLDLGEPYEEKNNDTD